MNLSHTLPDFSCMMKVGQLRHIQSTRESGAFWNPDTLVWQFLSPAQRWSCLWRGRLLLPRLRADPFYDYVLARTRYYDEVFVDALCAGVQRVINVGCGSDTRAYRYAHLLASKGIRVLECDQGAAIEAKQAIARRRLPVDQVDYASIDLNDGAWPHLEESIAAQPAGPTLVLMEGVSPYVNTDAFAAFLRLLATRLAAGSRVAYDYKIRGVRDGFGLEGRTSDPFRLSTAVSELDDFHRALGLRLVHSETSSALTARLLPGTAARPARVFAHDALVQLEVPSQA